MFDHKYRICGDVKAESIGSKSEWSYAFNVRIETEHGNLIIGTDKKRHPLEYGFVDADFEGKRAHAWIWNKRVIAALARIVEHKERYSKGQPIPIPTEAEADAIYAELKIPRCPDVNREILGRAIEVDWGEPN